MLELKNDSWKMIPELQKVLKTGLFSEDDISQIETLIESFQEAYDSKENLVFY